VVIMDGSIELPGARLAYTSTGAGPVVLHAHGLTSSRAADARRTVLAGFGPVAQAGHTLVSYDARGHGQSSGTADPEVYRWAALADDALALADRFSPDDAVAAIGASMGTATLLHAVLKAPGRFSRLVLTLPPTAWQTRAEQAGMYEQMATMVESTSPDQLKAVFAQAPVPEIFRDHPDAFADGPDVSPELLPSVLRGAARSDLPAPDLLTQITQPTLILAWTTDPTHPVSTAHALDDLLPNSTLHISDTVDDIAGWGARAAEFLATGETP
jgi:3-oxoadipate enol-lactonase